MKNEEDEINYVKFVISVFMHTVSHYKDQQEVFWIQLIVSLLHFFIMIASLPL